MRPPATQADGRAIRTVLLEIWDPIGIAEVPEAQGEYDGYIWPILTLLQRGVLEEALTEHLVSLTTDDIGLRPDRFRAKLAARALIELPLASASSQD